MSSTKNPGRFAGMLYLLTSIIGAFAIIYVPSKLIVNREHSGDRQQYHGLRDALSPRYRC